MFEYIHIQLVYLNGVCVYMSAFLPARLSASMVIVNSLCSVVFCQVKLLAHVHESKTRCKYTHAINALECHAIGKRMHCQCS